MLQDYDGSKADLTYFQSPGEGFTSWFRKVSWFSQKYKDLKFCDIVYARTPSGELYLEDRTIVHYIAANTNMERTNIAAMIEIDMKAIQPSASFRFVDEISPNKSIQSDRYPKQFCLTCFTNCLQQRKIPVFDPQWQFVWSTHCTKDGSPLYPAELLDGNRYHAYGFMQDDGSQYKNWINRIESFRSSLLGARKSTGELRVSSASKATLSVNKLFGDSKQSADGVTELGLSESVEWVRQKFYTIFFLLSRKPLKWSLGTHYTKLLDERDSFPSSNIFSSRVTDGLSPIQVDRCVEFTLQFLANPKAYSPYLLTDYMRNARADIFTRTKQDFPEIQKDPMLYLAYHVTDHFERTFIDLLDVLFPLYAGAWQEKCCRIKEILPV